MATVPALTDRTPAQRFAEVRDEHALWGDLRPELLEAVKTILEATMEDELTAQVMAERYERTEVRLDHRNGIYRRMLVTELGAITDLRVPRRRLEPYRPSFLARAARRTATVDDVLRRAFLRGLSTRETAALAQTLTGVSLSAAAISRLVRSLDAQVAAFHRRPVTFPARYLLLDGLWVSVRRGDGRASRRVILAAYGIDEHGHRELLDYRQATGESTAA
jgi:putative transposase